MVYRRKIYASLLAVNGNCSAHGGGGGGGEELNQKL